jgi:hypothetical protein
LPDFLRAATTGGFFLFTSQADETDPDMSFSLELLGGSFRVNGSARSGWEWKKATRQQQVIQTLPLVRLLK